MKWALNNNRAVSTGIDSGKTFSNCRLTDRYVDLLWPAFHMVYDLDDTRKNAYGSYYTQKKPLTLAALDNDLPGI